MYVGAGGARIANERVEALHNALGKVFGGGRYLCPRPQPLGVHEDKVGERAPNVNSDA